MPTERKLIPTLEGNHRGIAADVVKNVNKNAKVWNARNVSSKLSLISVAAVFDFSDHCHPFHLYYAAWECFGRLALLGHIGGKDLYLHIDCIRD